jgi:alpha/beta superfamily hydrolase
LKSQSQSRVLLPGAAGALEIVINEPDEPAWRGLALVAHPHPLYGGTLDNKVVQTLAKAFFALGYIAVRMNFRGVGASEGEHDNGEGETQDWLTVLQAMRERYGVLPLLLAGFSFGAFVQSRFAKLLTEQGDRPLCIVLVAPAVGRFTVESVPADTLVIHGDEDDVVPLADVLAWARPQQLPVTVLPGAGHFFHGYLPRLQQVVSRHCGAVGSVR